MLLQERNNLIVKHLPLVKKLAKLKKRKLHTFGQITLDDLISAGNAALVEAANRYDSRIGSFANFARRRIQGEMLEEIRRRTDGPKYGPFQSAVQLKDDDPSLTYNESFDDTVFEFVERYLPNREFRILRWYFADEMTHKQIGERIGVDESQISRLLSDINKKLRPALNDW